MDFGKEEKVLEQQSNTLTRRPSHRNTGRLRNLWWVRSTFPLQLFSSGRFFQVLIPNSGTCLLGVLDFSGWKLHNMTEYRKQLKWWLFDIQTCSDLGTCGCVYQGQRQKEGGSFSFLTCSWHIQAEAPLSLPHLLLCTELQRVCSAKRHLQEVSLPTNFLFWID